MEYELLDFFTEQPVMIGNEFQVREMQKDLANEGCLTLIRHGNKVEPFENCLDINNEP